MLDDAALPISSRTPFSISDTAAPRGLVDKTVTIASRTSPGRRRLSFDLFRGGMSRKKRVRRLDVFVKKFYRNLAKYVGISYSERILPMNGRISWLGVPDS